jgi:hypothetical protein
VVRLDFDLEDVSGVDVRRSADGAADRIFATPFIVPIVLG